MWSKFSLLLIVLLGSLLRFYNLNWDQGHFFHPDERNIALAVSRISFFDQLNPRFFAYGGLPLYLYRAIGEGLRILTRNPAWVHDWGHINLIGRGVSALVASLSIVLVYQLAKKVFAQKVALLSSLFLAFSPSLIQAAHFGTTESLLVFWLLLLLLNRENYLRAGVILGLALATKISAFSFLIIPAATDLKFLFFVPVSFLTLAFFSPYIFLDWQKFRQSMNYETGVVWGRLKVPYVLQFEKTRPYLFQIKNFFWQMGPVALLGILGMIGLLLLALKSEKKKLLSFLAFPIIYFLYVGSWYAKFIRYMVPVLPFLAIAAAWLIKRLGKILLGLTCLVTFLWGLAFFSIYTQEPSRITASKWIYQNIPQESKILTEHWDDGLPVSLNGHHPSEFKTEQLTIYEPDNEAKIEYFGEKLSGADFIIINSRRLYGTLMYLPEKYPITSHYYRLLFSGQLGYQKIAEFTVYPKIFGWQIRTDAAEETFQVYDHPKVLVFRNQGRFSQEQIGNLLTED